MANAPLPENTPPIVPTFDSDRIIIGSPYTPVYSSTFGDKGSICYDSNYVYFYNGAQWRKMPNGPVGGEFNLGIAYANSLTIKDTADDNTIFFEKFTAPSTSDISTLITRDVNGNYWWLADDTLYLANDSGGIVLNAPTYWINGLSDGVINISGSALSSGTVSIANGGTNATSFGANRIIFMNSGNTALSSNADLIYDGTYMQTTNAKFDHIYEKTASHKIVMGNGVTIGASGQIQDLGVSHTFTDVPTGNFISGQFTVYHNPSSSHGTYLIEGLNAAVYHYGENNNTTATGGIRGSQWSVGLYSGAGNVTSAVGMFMNVYNGSSTGGTITNAIDMYLMNPIGAGAITNNYGIYIENMTRGGTLNYSIYS